MAIAIAAYYGLYRFTGDSEILYAIMAGSAGWTAAWAYFFPGDLFPKK